ncbi:MAG: 2-amino-4-hydroxy-6-hydroxymethyldihydropteridine diphosphokinase [Tannerellaceae bacterium]|nr:2-amino-4-hydroxy-6-hydroxymethyldihydropteridine diphosphokinase [Tannerellaceae bacterium]
MENLNQYIITLGSNLNREANMEKASGLLCSFFKEIAFSRPVLTAPFPPDPYAADYLNRVATGRTVYSLEETIDFLKNTEKRLGRIPAGKASSTIPIDLDLICWNETILKPDDWQQNYVQQALEYLGFTDLKDQ